MNSISLRLKNNNKKAITPVIATIILIAVTLVLALVVGAYTFGLFGSNVKTIQLTAGILNSGSASTTCAGPNFQLTFNNPGGATYIESVSLSAGGQTAGGATYINSGSCSTAVYSPAASASFSVANGAGQQVTVYFGSALNSGSTYSYVITFGNGQSITGSLIAE